MVDKKKTKQKPKQPIKEINKAKKIVDIDAAKETDKEVEELVIEKAEEVVELVIEKAEEVVELVIEKAEEVEELVIEKAEEVEELVIEKAEEVEVSERNIVESNLDIRIKMLQERYGIDEVPETKMGQYQLKIWFKKKARQLKLEAEAEK